MYQYVCWELSCRLKVHFWLSWSANSLTASINGVGPGGFISCYFLDHLHHITIEHYRNWKELNLSFCHIQDYGLRLLHHTLCRYYLYNICLEDNITAIFIMSGNCIYASSSSWQLLFSCFMNIFPVCKPSDSKSLISILTAHYLTSLHVQVTKG